MILIVDDFPDGAYALNVIITRMGYPCALSASGPEALAYIRAHPPEMPLLVLLDHMMPGMTGIEVLREIRTDPRISHATVVMFSAGFELAARDEAITLGAAAWLLKGGTSAGGFDGLVETVCKTYEKVGGVKTGQSQAEA